MIDDEQHGENALTERLGALLRYPALARALLESIYGHTVPDHVAPRVRTQVHHRQTGSRPDLVVTADSLLVWIEAKLGAGLTDRQPVSYVQALAERLPLRGRLVFLVPTHRLAEVGASVKSRLGVPLDWGLDFVRMGVQVTIVSWSSVRDAILAADLVESDVCAVAESFGRYVDEKVEEFRVGMSGRMLPALARVDALAAYAALEDLLTEVREALNGLGLTVRPQDPGELRQNGFYVGESRVQSRQVWIGIVVRAGVCWPERGPIWLWLFGRAYDASVQAKVRALGYEVLADQRRLPQWAMCPLVPLPLSSVPVAAQKTELVRRTAEIIGLLR